MDPLADPHTVAAIASARRAHARATTQWVCEGEDDPASECEALCRDALEHLEEGRWDEACACAESAQDLAEERGQPHLWREFNLLVEEAAELGRS